MQTRPMQFAGKWRMVRFDAVWGEQEEVPEHAPLARAADRGLAIRFEAADDRRFRSPAHGQYACLLNC